MVDQEGGPVTEPPGRKVRTYSFTGSSVSQPGLNACDQASLGDLVEVNTARVRREFINLYDQEHQRLVVFLMSTGASFPAAEDAMQEAFADAWALVQSGEWETITNPPGWIRVVGLRKFYRQQGRSRTSLTLPDAVEAPTRAEPLAELAAGTNVVLQALASLLPDQRAAIAFMMDGFSCQETADYLGITNQQVRDLRKKARRKLAGQLGEDQERTERQ
jgi:RNA polymerase sigma factor (sigma-70 family)